MIYLDIIVQLQSGHNKLRNKKVIKVRSSSQNLSRFPNITLLFTDLRCGKIASEMKILIRKICPNFTHNLSFINIQLKNFISPPLRPRISEKLKSGFIYEFTYPYFEKYIGETKRLLCYRVQQHRRDHDFHKFSNLQTCSKYQNLL